MLYKKANFVPFRLQIPRNLIVLCKISKITAGPSLLPFSAFVLCSDFPTLMLLGNTLLIAALSSLLIDYYYLQHSFCYYPLSPSLAHKTRQDFLFL